MLDAKDLGFDPERLRRRVDFLKDRAIAHEEAKGRTEMADAACAAALLRDAGATALLLGDLDTAVAFLRDAGRRWANLGLFGGYALLRLADGGAWENRESDLKRIQEYLVDEREISDSKERLARFAAELPFFEGSLSSARQLLNLYQAILPTPSFNGGFESLRDTIHKRLVDAAVTSAGPADMPMRSYLRLLDDAATGDIGASSQKNFQAIVFQRDSQLSVAREDGFHWQHALGPTDLIDLDLLVVCLAAVESKSLKLFEVDFDSFDPLLKQTVEVAARLRPQAPPKPRLEPRFR